MSVVQFDSFSHRLDQFCPLSSLIHLVITLFLVRVQLCLRQIFFFLLLFWSWKVYDIEKDNWKTEASLCEPRTSVSAAALEGRIFAVGGHDGQRALSSVEVYDSEAECWTHTAGEVYLSITAHLLLVTIYNIVLASDLVLSVPCTIHIFCYCNLYSVLSWGDHVRLTGCKNPTTN